MKIALIGNMNFTNYVLTKLLRKKGIDAHLFLLDNENEKFLVENEDGFLKDNYPSWITKCNWGSQWSFLKNNAKDIQQKFSDFDFIIACGYAPAFLEKGKIHNFLFLPYGSDLYQIPFWDRLPRVYNPLYFILNLLISYYQRKGIQNCRGVSLVATFEGYENALMKIGVQNNRIELGFAIDMDLFNIQKISNANKLYTNENFLRIVKIKEQYDIIVFSPTRHIWTSQNLKNDPLTSKGNNILIEGVARAIHSKKINVLLILVKIGNDIDNSKKLIEQLKIKNNVIWIEPIPRQELRYFYFISDIIGDQFGQKAGYGAISVEGFSMERPVLLSLENTKVKFSSIIEEPPCLNVNNSTDISNYINDYINNREKYVAIGKNARQWVEKYKGDGLINEYIRLFNHLKNGNSIDQFHPQFLKND